MMTLAVPIATTAVPIEQSMMSAYDRLCATGTPSTLATLARADRDGWQSAGPQAPEGFDAATNRFKPVGTTIVKLMVRETQVADERFDTCGISIVSAAPNLAADVRQDLGFAPAFSIGHAATFYAIRDGSRWRDAAKLSPTDFAAAKASGSFYSVMVTSLDTGSSLFSLRIVPATRGKAEETH